MGPAIQAQLTNMQASLEAAITALEMRMINGPGRSHNTLVQGADLAFDEMVRETAFVANAAVDGQYRNGPSMPGLQYYKYTES